MAAQGGPVRLARKEAVGMDRLIEEYIQEMNEILKEDGIAVKNIVLK
mgnify:CR=1 FL=1